MAPPSVRGFVRALSIPVEADSTTAPLFAPQRGDFLAVGGQRDAVLQTRAAAARTATEPNSHRHPVRSRRAGLCACFTRQLTSAHGSLRSSADEPRLPH